MRKFNFILCTFLLLFVFSTAHACQQSKTFFNRNFYELKDFLNNDFDQDHANDIVDGELFISASGEILKLSKDAITKEATAIRYYWKCCQCGWHNRYYYVPCGDGHNDGTKPPCNHMECKGCVSVGVDWDWPGDGW